MMLISYLDKIKKYFIKTIVWEKIAAAVFEHGRLEQSPRAQIFGYFVCLSVCLSTSTNPASLVRPAYFRNAGGLIGGTK